MGRRKIKCLKTKKIVIAVIALIFIMLAVVGCLKKDEIKLSMEQRSIINKLQSYSDTLDILEDLYDRQQTEMTMDIENNHLKIIKGSAENIAEKEEEIKKFFMVKSLGKTGILAENIILDDLVRCFSINMI